METTTAAVVDSPSTQTFEIPSDPAQNLEWRKTGEIPAASTAKSKAASTPAKETASAKAASADTGDGDDAETAAASATADPAGDKTKRTAADRLNELLGDLRKAGYTPAELKSLRREAAAADPAKPEPTVKPQGLTAPVKPTKADRNADGSEKYPTWEALEEARDKYHEDFADYKAKLAVEEDRQARAAEAQQQTLKQKVTDAKARYGEETESSINTAVKAVIGDKSISPAVRQMLDESPVVVDLMYVLGSKPEELASFVELAKTNPGAAIRKVVVLEQLVTAELAKGGKASTDAAAGAAEDVDASAGAAGERDARGQFVSQKTPAKDKPAAPPPPEELSTRRTAPADASDAALKNGDFTSFHAEETRREIARRRGA